MRTIQPVSWTEPCEMCGAKYELNILFEKYEMLLCPRCLELMERKEEEK